MTAAAVAPAALGLRRARAAEFTPADRVRPMKDRLLAASWPDGLPSTGPDRVSVGDLTVARPWALRGDLLSFGQPLGVSWETYEQAWLWTQGRLYLPESWDSGPRHAVIYVAGHEGLLVEEEVVRWHCERGRVVLGLTMPLIEPNPYALNVIPVAGTFVNFHTSASSGSGSAGVHDQLGVFEQLKSETRTLPLFVDQVWRSVLLLREWFPGWRVSIAGKSGGAWTAVMAAAALPERTFDTVYAVAGTLSSKLFVPSDGVGDFEQRVDLRPFYAGLDFEDLYAVGAAACRRYVVVHNYRDTVYPASVPGRWEALGRMQDAVERAAFGGFSDGRFRVRVDCSHPDVAHVFSESERDHFLQVMDEGSA